MLAKDWQTGEVLLCFGLQKTDDFVSWEAFEGVTSITFGANGQFKVSLPLSTPRRTWVFHGVEVVPDRPDVVLDAELAGRIRGWFEYYAEREVRRVLRRQRRWKAGAYRVDLPRLVERFIDQVAERLLPLKERT